MCSDSPEESAANRPDGVAVLGVHVATLSLAELHARIADHIRYKRHALVLHVNAHGLNLACEQTWLRDFLRTADTVFCDGVGVLVGARLLGYRIPHRITYADWMWQLAEFAQLRSYSFFFLGARPGIAEKAAERLRQCFPSLHVTGVHHGYFDKTSGSTENKAIQQVINAANPNILIVAFGMPEQERWLMENWNFINADVALTGGAVFDYISGELRRGPRWMTDNGLEWLARMIIEPKRLWRRYLIGNPLFLWRVLKQRVGRLGFD